MTRVIRLLEIFLFLFLFFFCTMNIFIFFFWYQKSTPFERDKDTDMPHCCKRWISSSASSSGSYRHDVCAVFLYDFLTTRLNVLRNIRFPRAICTYGKTISARTEWKKNFYYWRRENRSLTGSGKICVTWKKISFLTFLNVRGNGTYVTLV